MYGLDTHQRWVRVRLRLLLCSFPTVAAFNLRVQGLGFRVLGLRFRV